MDAAAQGAAALASKDFTSAISHYTRAISSHPQAVDYYIKRSTAYTRISPPDPTLALSDAETAVVLAHKRGKRELIAQAQLRRGIALFGLERWADAGACFGWAKKLTPKEGSLPIWEMKVKGKLDSLELGDERGAASVKEMPDVNIDALGKEAKKVGKECEKVEKPAGIEEPRVEGVQTPASKIRHEWYQTNDTVVITLFAKGVPKDKAIIDIQSQSMAISFPLPTGSDFDFSLDPLFATIDPKSSTHKIMSTKVEFILQKATPGQKWASIESASPIPSSNTQSGTSDDDTVKRAILNSTNTNKNLPSAPTYPTSSKTGPKNWDKLATDLTAPKKKPKKPATSSSDPSAHTEEEEEEDEYIEEGDPVNGFFKKLFAGADPDTQRAMMKSYQESNGTALSTNWAEVGKGRVETSPPEGMVAKKWGE